MLTPISQNKASTTVTKSNPNNRAKTNLTFYLKFI